MRHIGVVKVSGTIHLVLMGAEETILRVLEAPGSWGIWVYITHTKVGEESIR
jgi:hypothetical protein